MWMSNRAAGCAGSLRSSWVCLIAGALALVGMSGWAEAATPRKIVLIAGTVHQGPGGHPAGTHEYELSARLLKQSLLRAPGLAPIKCEVHVGCWPTDPQTLDDADTIVLISDGADRNEQDHPLL